MTAVFGRKDGFWLEVTPRDDLRHAGETAAEHSTLASWRMGVGRMCLTVAHELTGGDTVDRVEDVPLIDLAVWFARAWRELLCGQETPGTWPDKRSSVMADALADALAESRSRRRESARRWAEYHSLEWAATDYSVPSVVFRRRDAGIELSWRSQEPADSLSGLIFDGPRGAAVVSVEHFAEAVQGLADWVMQRCQEDQVRDMRLRDLTNWRNSPAVPPEEVVTWLDSFVTGGATWLAQVAPSALSELQQSGSSRQPAFSFLRSAQGIHDAAMLANTWKRLDAALSAKSVAKALSALGANIVPRVNPAEPWQSGYALAQQVRPRVQQMLGITSDHVVAIDMTAVLDRLAIPMMRSDDLPPTVQGAARMTESGRAAVLVNSASTLGSGLAGSRAILAHELCHLLFDRNRAGALGQVDLRRDLAHNLLLEQRANAFAAELLLPRSEVKRLSVGGKVRREDLRRLARDFGAGLDLAFYQASNAKIRVE